MQDTARSDIRLGLRANAGQLLLLVGVNGMVGALIGQGRTLVPLLGIEVFGLRSASAVLAFIMAFGAAKALTNLVAGALAGRVERRRLLILGWLVGVPVPLILMWAPSWGWVVISSVLLGVNQGLTWSLTVIMKIDLAGSERRGMVTGLNEFAGYAAVALSAWVSGLLAARYGLRPEPLFLGLAVAGLGLGLSLFVRDTAGHVRLEAAAHGGRTLTTRKVAALVSYRHRGLASVSRTGLVNNATDAIAWGLLPVIFVEAGLGTAQIGTLVALAAGTWGVAQLATGPLSDRIGRRLPIASGMWLQAAALAWLAMVDDTAAWAVGSVAYGLGTALAYPALLAAVGDLAAPAWRAQAIGVYRLWRDTGYVVGALVASFVADVLGLGLRAGIGTVAAAALVAGGDTWWNLSERRRTQEVVDV
ncbi:MAG: MFS transporter [Actinomycetota bacterium]